MTKRVKIVLGILAVALVGMIVWQTTQPGEPVYQGKPLSGWLKAAATTGTQPACDKADEAVRQAGTNAIPTLLRLLRVKDSALWVQFMSLVQRKQSIKIEFTLAGDWNKAGSYGFQALGTNAQSAVQALIRIANQNISPASQESAIAALDFIGPPAKEAVPSLLRWATNADGFVRNEAIWALGSIHAEPERVVPVLIIGLHDPVGVVRLLAVQSLGQFGPDAKLAVPALVESLNDPDADVRELATNLLKKLDPEAAAKAGVK